MTTPRTPAPADRARQPRHDDPPVARPGGSDSPQEPTGHYGPGYGDPTPVDPEREQRKDRGGPEVPPGTRRR